MVSIQKDTPTIFQERTKIKWDEIRSIRVSDQWFFANRKIIITSTVGSTESISLPLHTNAQLTMLKRYLSEACIDKKVSFTN